MSKGKPWSETRLNTHVLLLPLRNTWERREVSASYPDIANFALNCKSHLLHLGAKRVVMREGDGVRMNRTARGGFCKVTTAAEWPLLRWPKLSRNCRASSIALNLKCYLLRNPVGKASCAYPKPLALVVTGWAQHHRRAVPSQPRGSAPRRGHHQCCPCRPRGPAFPGKPLHLCIPGCGGTGL